MPGWWESLSANTHVDKLACGHLASFLESPFMHSALDKTHAVDSWIFGSLSSPTEVAFPPATPVLQILTEFHFFSDIC